MGRGRRSTRLTPYLKAGDLVGYRTALESVIWEEQGSIGRIATALDCSPRTVRLHVTRLGLWGVVDHARGSVVPLIARARALLRGDPPMNANTQAQVQACCAGMTLDEIEQQIGESQHAAEIPDPEGLARFLAAVAQSDGATGEEPEPAVED